jgi:hypothetical protein
MTNLESHNVHELVPRASGTRTLILGWVLHQKSKNSILEKNKAMLVVLGNYQRRSIDYSEPFSPVMRLESLRTLLTTAAIRDLDIDGYIAPGKEHWVWRLKGLYGRRHRTRS